MAWVMRNLFIEDGDGEEPVGEEDVMTHLRELTAESCGAQALTLSAPLQRWRVVSGTGGWLEDLPQAAKAMAERLGRRVISCELIAHSFLLRIGENQPGGAQKLLQSPDLPWGAATPHRGEMPLYEDVEQRALATLVGMGVPRFLVLLAVPALGAEGKIDLGTGVERHANEEGDIEERACSLFAPKLHASDGSESDATPVVPREHDAGFGLSLSDDRYVEGRPSGRAVDRLVELEEALLARAKACSPGAKVRMIISYHAGSFQADLDEMLRARDRFVPPSPRPATPPWWQFWRYFGFKRR
ncbi:MAG: hypothetical protein JRH20_00975 [Deltaproteobacteria bacterium]|nr:hypothetical protein [Deltaproteobacteria bacterium]